MLTRRTALFGLLAAPAIIKTSGLLMPIKPEFCTISWTMWENETGRLCKYKMFFSKQIATNLRLLQVNALLNNKKLPIRNIMEKSYEVYKDDVLIKSRNGFV